MNKNTFLILLLIFFLPVFSIAQDAKSQIENLKAQLKENPDAKKTASIYSDLTWYYSNISSDSALHYGSKAILESKKLGDSTLLAQVFSDIGGVYFIKGDFQNSKGNYLLAYKIRKARKDYKGLAKINNNLANIYEKTEQYKLAMATFLESLKYFEGINDEKNCNTIKGNIGLIHLKLKNYPKALKYISEVVHYQEKNNFMDGLCISCLNLGNVYLQMNDTVNALNFYNKSVKACTIVGNQKGISSGYNNIGSIKTEQKKSKDAIAFYEKSLKIRKALNSDLDKANFDVNLAKEYSAEKRFKEAKNLLISTKKFFEVKKLDDKLQVNYKSLIEICAKLNQPDSVIYYIDKLSKVNKTLLESSSIKQTAELETKYQTEKKEKLILKSKAEIAERELEIKNKETQFLILSLISLALLSIIYLIYRQQKLKNKQQEQEFQLKTAISQIETQNKLQEQRLLISRDLHDNIGSQLTFIISSVDTIKFNNDNLNPVLESKLEKISHFTKDTIVELRDTIWAMNNNAISFEDLKMRILNFVEKAQNSQDTIDFIIEIDTNLNNYVWTSVAGMNIYRTIQEAINNALKYANATVISIDIKEIKDKILITIQDNGIGFDMENVSYGNGILNMQKRIEDINGTINIQSKLNVGTTIVVQINRENAS